MSIMATARDNAEGDADVDDDVEIGEWRRTWDPADHAAAVDAVRAAIGRGDVYQVNLVQHLSPVPRDRRARSPPGSLL